MSGHDEDKNSVSPSLQAPPQGESFRITARASMLTGRILKIIDETGHYDWKAISNAIQDTLDGFELDVLRQVKR